MEKEQHIISGKCGDDLYWRFEDETLYIEGIGRMYNVHWCSDNRDWDDVKTNIRRLIIQEGCTYISYMAFSGCRSLQSIEIPDSVTEIGEDAFDGCISMMLAIVPDSITTLAMRDWWREHPPQAIYVNNSEESLQMLRERVFSNCNPQLKLKVRKTYSPRTWSCW